MRTVITVKDLAHLKARSSNEYVAPANAILTPSAADFLRHLGVSVRFDGAAATSQPPAKKPAGGGAYVSDASAVARPKAEHAKLFASKEAQAIKDQICSVGHRLWKREYVDGNGGNISFRIGENEVLCTPTLVSKGMLTPEDICLVDLDGNQLAGTKKRTSEILLHLEIMKANPKARACVHAHPPHATAYAITDACVPSCMIPEMEVLVGKVGRTPYETPGTKAFAETVLPVCKDHNAILLQNHGVITWADDLERAYWFMEIVDAYCRTVVIASHIGGQMTYMSPGKVGDLLKIKQTLGLPDARYNLKPADYCACEFRPGAVCGTTSQKSSTAADGEAETPEAEAVVQMVTDEVMRALAR